VQQVAKRGAFVGFDRVTLEGILPDADRVVMVMSFVDAGYADQLLLSSDFSQEKALKKNGRVSPVVHLSRHSTVFFIATAPLDISGHVNLSPKMREGCRASTIDRPWRPNHTLHWCSREGALGRPIRWDFFVISPRTIRI
jgi:hypothetical protein